ncbi:MAG: endolytic transglycosylase MltG [Sulfurospirillum sp.]
MSKKTIQIFLITCDVALIIMISLIFHLARPMETSKVVYIPRGSVSQIISYLETNNFSISKRADKYLLYFIGKPQFGWINIGETRLSRGDFFYKLSHSKAALKTLTLIPGETTVVFLKKTSKEFNLSFGKLYNFFIQSSPFKEGLLIPESYNMPMGISEKHLIYYLINSSLKTHKENSMKIFGEYNQDKWYKYLIVASIIQKEAANKKEMPIVSSVIYNRLKKKMKLQMDGALNYGLYSHIKVTARRIKEDKTKYNTYRYSGLPKYPVCNVGKAAIIAAIFPKKTGFLYFVKNSKGVHYFSKTYKRHKMYVKKLQK